MKTLLLCDDCNIQEVSKLSKKHKLGIEVQSYFKPNMFDDVVQLDIHRKCITGVSPLCLHAPYGDLCPGSFDPMVRDVARNRFELAYKVSTQLNITNMVFHVGWIPGAGNINNWANRCVDFWNDYTDKKPDDMNFYIENLFDLDPEMLLLLMDGINKQNVKVCLDIGHLHCKSKLNEIEWIRVLGKSIGYVHIHDNHGVEDEHLGIGKGNIPMVETLTALNNYAPEAKWAIETHVEDIVQSLEWLKENGFFPTP